ncbi:MAG TPA: hypothetical protein VL003_02050 [Pusillimonas sp.]|nr:hypothetical protein [Pusillimonas sp.]HUH86821.1 hypothetical protein [Pusillimonas sp.]
MKPRNASFRKTWRAPIALALLTCAGLLSALFGTGAWHWASWLCLAILPVTAVGYWLRPRSRAAPPTPI